MSKSMKKAIMFYIIAFICYICAVVWFVSGKAGLGAMWLFIGAANMCLGTVWMRKSNEVEQQYR